MEEMIATKTAPGARRSGGGHASRVGGPRTSPPRRRLQRTRTGAGGGYLNEVRSR